MDPKTIMQCEVKINIAEDLLREVLTDIAGTDLDREKFYDLSHNNLVAIYGLRNTLTRFKLKGLNSHE